MPPEINEGDGATGELAPTKESDRPASRPAGEVANEDFLFHLYRGSELLQDNRVLEAKEELEHALMFQPRDTKGQDLLAVVYFRIGHYPRAIQIYERLKKDNPRDVSLRTNLALCYLKTGQAQAARLELEEVVQAHPEHRRAWGYLGLAYERLGDLDKAEGAFERGSHPSMAKRMAQRRSMLPSPQQAETASTLEALQTASAVFQELDSGDLNFAIAEQTMHQTESGNWRAIELGASSRKVSPDAPLSLSALEQVTSVPVASPQTVETPPWVEKSVEHRGATPLSKFAQEILLDRQEGMPSAQRDQHQDIALHKTGLLVVQTRAEALARGFAARMEALRSFSGPLKTAILERKTRGPAASEPFGGLASPLVTMKDSTLLVLGPRPPHKLSLLALDGHIAYIREDLVLGFDLKLTFENGRIVFGETDSTPIVQFQGEGALVLELLHDLVALHATSAQGVSVRRASVVGWLGRLVPRAVPPAEAPSGQRGLVSFAGEGTLFLQGA